VPSKYTDYHIGKRHSSGVLKELRAACDKNGVQFGTYYSLLDWRIRLSARSSGAHEKTIDMPRFYQLIRIKQGADR